MNRAQLIIFGSIGVIVVLALGLITGTIPGLKERPPPPFTLTIWGPGDDPELWGTIGAEYREQAVETATVTYIKKNPAAYEAELVNALAAGSGPDIFILPDGWLARHRDKLSPLGEGELGYRKRDSRNVFADGVATAISDDSGALLGTPLFLDTLALFYNRDYLNAAGIPAPPRTWDELATQSKTLTRRSALGGIERAGAAIGTAANVEHAADILSVLIYQAGGMILDAGRGKAALDHPATVSALGFYTAFANPPKATYAWNAFFEDSLTAFAAGHAAMAFGYAGDAPGVVARNPQLNFDIAPLPQAAGVKAEITFGRFHLAAVSRTSPERNQAWRFLLWLQGKGVQKLYIDAAGLPPARRDLVTSNPPREYLIPFYDQVLTARTRPVAAGDSLSKILSDMIDDVANRRFSIEQAIGRAERELNAVLRPEP